MEKKYKRPFLFVKRRAKHCVKDIKIRGFLWFVFSCIRTKKSEIYSVKPRIQSEYG